VRIPLILAMLATMGCAPKMDGHFQRAMEAYNSFLNAEQPLGTTVTDKEIILDESLREFSLSNVEEAQNYLGTAFFLKAKTNLSQGEPYLAYADSATITLEGAQDLDLEQRLALGGAYRLLSDMDNATRVLREAREAGHDDYRLLNAYAHAAQQNTTPVPEGDFAAFEYATMLVRNQNYEAALTIIGEPRTLEDQRMRAVSLYHLAQTSPERQAEADEALSLAVIASPDDHVAVAYLAANLMNESRFDDARASMSDWLEPHQDEPDLLLDMGAELYGLAESNQHGNADALHTLGRLFTMRALAMQPDNTVYQDAYRQRGGGQ